MIKITKEIKTKLLEMGFKNSYVEGTWFKKYQTDLKGAYLELIINPLNTELDFVINTILQCCELDDYHIDENTIVDCEMMCQTLDIIQDILTLKSLNII